MPSTKARGRLVKPEVAPYCSEQFSNPYSNLRMENLSLSRERPTIGIGEAVRSSGASGFY